jgi:hypothetical protein
MFILDNRGLLHQKCLFQVLTAPSVKIYFWDIAPCNLVEGDEADHPDDGGSKHI